MFKAFPLKRQITDSQHFIDDENLRIEVGCHRIRQTDVHSTGITLHGSIKELGHLSEADDVIKLSRYLASRHSQYGTVKVDVLAASQFRMKTRPDLQ